MQSSAPPLGLNLAVRRALSSECIKYAVSRAKLQYHQPIGSSLPSHLLSRWAKGPLHSSQQLQEEPSKDLKESQLATFTIEWERENHATTVIDRRVIFATACNATEQLAAATGKWSSKVRTNLQLRPSCAQPYRTVCGKNTKKKWPS